MKKRAYAKINIALNVTGKQEKMHTLDMIMSEIGLFDEIEILDNSSDGVVINGMDFCPKEDNLMYKAVKLFEKTFNIACNGLTINIVKSIPHQAGLGGGSSDAVCVFKMLCEKYNIEIEDRKMIEIVKLLGSDCPFFVLGGICRVESTGDVVIQLKNKKVDNILIVKPKFGLSTKMIFDECDKYGFNSKKNIIDEISRKVINGDDYLTMSFNDLENSARMVSNIGKYIDGLKKYDFAKIFMTGSGSSIVCVKKGDVAIEEIRSEFKDCLIYSL